MPHSRQTRRRALRAERPAAEMFHGPNRKARRAVRERRGLAVSPVDAGWVAGLLEGNSWVGNQRRYVPRPGYLPGIAIEASPRVLTALRRRLGGVVSGGRWLAVGRRAESLLLPIQDRLIAHHEDAIVALGVAEYQRQHKAISPETVRAFLSRLVPSHT